MHCFRGRNQDISLSLSLLCLIMIKLCMQCASFLFNAESLSSLHKLSMSLLDTEEDLPVSGHEDQGVDGDVGGDVDDVLGSPVHGHQVSKVSGDI